MKYEEGQNGKSARTTADTTAKIPALKEIIEERKNRAVETLSVSYAKNRLPLEEYERLVEYINKIESERELVIVEKIVAEYEEKPAYHEQKKETDNTHSSNNYQNSDVNLAIFSTRNFTGPVKTGMQFISILGSQQIKLRKKDLTGSKTYLEIVTILGDTTIYVESGIRAVNRSVPVLANSDVSQKVTRQAEITGNPDEDRELIITGVALLGNISIKLLKE